MVNIYAQIIRVVMWMTIDKCEVAAVSVSGGSMQERSLQAGKGRDCHANKNQEENCSSEAGDP